MSSTRVRFAPSPTGGLHIGGLRTALFNYLFAKNKNGQFILRIEDTDQNRYVEGAEKYIIDALSWIGIKPDEGPEIGGDYGPYRQSERKKMYAKYVSQLLDSGHAYYAFDTPDEIEEMREKQQKAGVSNPQYDALTRGTMRNSLTLSTEELNKLLNDGTPYVVRANISPKEEIRFKDVVRDWVKVHGTVLDDKVLMKSDGMPTYHLANVVDDYLMKITHVIRGEEWLPSTPLHVFLYKSFGWENEMPQFVHLPLILKPDGNGKLSKRVADKGGFPIFPINWRSPDSSETSTGFKETGYLPQALRNFLVLLGWNPGNNEEIFSMEELIQKFSLERINKAGTKFDLEKANSFNQYYLKNTDEKVLKDKVTQDLKEENITIDESTAIKLIRLLKDRVTFPQEIAKESKVILKAPNEFDEKVIRKKWNKEASEALGLFSKELKILKTENPEIIKESYFNVLQENDYNPGKYMQILRVSLTGSAGGPDLMSILALMGTKEASKRINRAIEVFNGYGK